MFKNILFAFVSLVLLSACGLSEVENSSSEEEVLIENENLGEEVVEEDLNDWQVYRNEELGFELRYPSEWGEPNVLISTLDEAKTNFLKKNILLIKSSPTVDQREVLENFYCDQNASYINSSETLFSCSNLKTDDNRNILQVSDWNYGNKDQDFGTRFILGTENKDFAALTVGWRWGSKCFDDFFDNFPPDSNNPPKYIHSQEFYDNCRKENENDLKIFEEFVKSIKFIKTEIN
jgi:hypothetical protein